MILILEATGPEASQLGSTSREFSAAGGVIGRDKQSQWVLPHTKVSGRHAVITFSHGTFHIEDKSRNGVFLNSPKNRLERDRPYPLKPGDRLYIDPYVIDVSAIERPAGIRPGTTWTRWILPATRRDTATSIRRRRALGTTRHAS